ncbi:MAG: VCBS domain-containing protein, partial [Chlorobium sp.]
LTHVTGALSASDLDNNATQTWSIQGTASATYGTMTINATTGLWDYALNNSLPATQALREGDVVTETFTARVTDDKGASVDQSVTITIIGTNDVPLVANASWALLGRVTEAGNLDNGKVVSGISMTSAPLSATDVDAGATRVWSLAGDPESTYGVMNLDSSTGKWRYTIDNTLAATQALREGDVVTLSYIARVTDDRGASVDQTIAITINGTNDSPVMVADTYTTSENVMLTVNAANGLLANDTDPDAGTTLTVNAVNGLSSNVGAAVTGTNGALFTVAADGSYSFNPGSTTFDYLAVGETATTSVNYTVTDDKGATSSSRVTVTLTGTNDAAVVASTDVTGAVSETIGTPAALATLTDSGTLWFSDVDLSDLHTVSAVTASTGALGVLTVTKSRDTTGTGTGGVISWNYIVGAGVVEYLAEGQTRDETFTFTLGDGGGTVERTVTVTLTGTNDLPSIAGASTTASGAFTEAALTTGSATVHTVSGSIAFFDADLTDTHTVTVTGADVVRSGGTLTESQQAALLAAFHLDARVESTTTGGGTEAWHFTAADSTFDYLVNNETLAATYTITVDDSHTGGMVTQDVVITITGTNDAAVITGTSTASLTESDAVLAATGTLSATDVDSLATFVAQTNVAGTNRYGKFSIGADGVWSYTAGSAHNEFVAGTSYTDSVTVATADGTQQVVAVTIAGTNDAAAITGSSTARLTEAKTALAATGTLSATDVDGAATFVAQRNVAGSNGYGSFSIGTNGVWNYTTNSAHGEFVAGTNYTDSFTVRTADGTPQLVSVTIAGSNSGSVITGTSSASLIESNAVLTATGTLVATEFDRPTTFAAQTNVAGNHGYGKFTIRADGVWSYRADTAHKEFAGGTTYTDSITVATPDGTQQLVEVTIAGVNDAAVITGISTASLTEAKKALSATGTLSATDVDSQALFVAQRSVAGSNGYGHFTIGTNGVWSYSMDSAHGEFVSGTNYTDSLMVTTADGTPQLVTVTIAGSNSGAVISGISTATLTESDAVLTASGTLVATDLDRPMTFVARTNVAGSNGYGKFTIGADGLWSYKANSAHNEFTYGTDYTDSLTVSTADGTEQVITVTVAGTNDAAVISGTSRASLTQSSVPLTATGKLSAADVDSAATFVAQTNVAGSQGYGHFSIGADGVWSYTADSAHREFLGGVDYTDRLTLSTVDGTQQLVSVTMKGVDDPAVLSSVISTLPESSTLRTTGGALTIRDADTPTPVFVAQAATHGTNGTFALGTDGVWSYTFDPGIVFTAGASYSDIFRVFSADGAATTVSVYKTSGPISLGNDSAGVSLVDLTVPVGITFSEEHSPDNTVTNLRDQLIGASESKIGDAAFFEEILNGGIDAYLLTLQDQPQVTVRTITFSNDFAGTTASSDPIIITGASGTGEDSTANPNRQEALVVDATNLPSGSVIQFNNVGFAIIIGAVLVTGGDGKNFVIGDSASQWIVLGADDDTLYGGGGDDVIGSHGGNDLLYGDAGDDTLSGGIENDTLCGGSGDDVLYGDESTTGGDGVDTALYTDALAGITVNLVAGTGDDGILYTTKEGGTRTGHDTLFDIENIVAGDFDDAIIGNNIANKLEGGKGDDTLTGGGGNDTLDGGAGTNTAVFSGNYADYTISYDEATQTHTVLDKVVGRDGTDVVTHVENFQFADGTHQ